MGLLGKLRLLRRLAPRNDRKEAGMMVEECLDPGLRRDDRKEAG